MNEITTQQLLVDSVIALVSGIVSGAIVAFATYRIISWRDKQALRDKFGKADDEGKAYKGYRFEKYDEDDGEHKKGEFKWVLEKEPASEARIKYKQNNILSITLTSLEAKNSETGEHLVWDGEMAMESENFGTVVWRYTNLPKPQHRFGFKRCIVKEEFDKVYVYLVGEEIEGYGKEVLIRNRT